VIDGEVCFSDIQCVRKETKPLVTDTSS